MNRVEILQLLGIGTGDGWMITLVGVALYVAN